MRGLGNRLVLASHNAGKLREIVALLAPLAVEIVSAASLGLPEPEETEDSFAGNAALKAQAAARASGLVSLADDSGFCVDALDGAPGVYSARWAGPAKDFAAAMARVHREMAGAADDGARFVCALCVAWPDGESAGFLGEVRGRVVWPPRGSLGFGYDPMFVPAGGTRSYGEMGAAEKHRDSHRGRAMAALLAAVRRAATGGSLL